MAYRRFELNAVFATVATSATLSDEPIHTVAEVATVATGHLEKPGADPSALSADIAVALERATARLRDKTGGSQQDVWPQACALVCADLRNSLAFHVSQADPNRCHVCGEREEPERPFIAVLRAYQEINESIL